MTLDVTCFLSQSGKIRIPAEIVNRKDLDMPLLFRGLSRRISSNESLNYFRQFTWYTGSQGNLFDRPKASQRMDEQVIDRQPTAVDEHGEIHDQVEHVQIGSVVAHVS